MNIPDTNSAALGKVNIKTISKAVDEEIEYIEKRFLGQEKSLLTPWAKFNKASMNGIEFGTIITIAGVSGHAKTTIVNLLETGLFDCNPDINFSVLSFNFEMASRRLVGRKFSNKTKKSVKQLYSADKDNPIDQSVIDDLKKIGNDLRKYHIWYADMPGTADEIGEAILAFSQLEENQDRRFIVTLDHSILVKKSLGGDERSTLVDLASMFNKIKKILPVSFIILSQLNGNIEMPDRRDNPMLHYPTKSDVFGSSALYMFSDLVLISHIPEKLKIREYGPERIPTKDVIFWHFDKVREGEPFIAKMWNNLKHNEIRDWEDRPKENEPKF